MEPSCKSKILAQRLLVMDVTLMDLYAQTIKEIP